MGKRGSRSVGRSVRVMSYRVFHLMNEGGKFKLWCCVSGVLHDSLDLSTA